MYLLRLAIQSLANRRFSALLTVIAIALSVTLLLAVERVLKEGRLNRGNRALRRDMERSYPVHNMIGTSDAMQELKHRIHRVGPTNTPVLIMGESGTGKEVVAQALHLVKTFEDVGGAPSGVALLL